MGEVTQVPALPSGQRPETGPMQFGEDWPGIFIRGDGALFTAMFLSQAMARLPEDAWMERSHLSNLAKLLRSCSVGNTGWPPAQRDIQEVGG